MPRPRFSDRILTTPVTGPIVIAGSGSVDYPIDLIDSFYPQIMIKLVYAKTAGTTGCSVVFVNGFVVDAAGTIEYCDNSTGTTITMSTVATSQSTTQTTRTPYNINGEQNPRFNMLHITNNDATNSVSVYVYGDW